MNTNDSQASFNPGLRNKAVALFRRHWPMLLLVALVFVFLGDVWFGGRLLIPRDYFSFDMVTRTLCGKAIQEGKLPLWTPLFQCGMPFIASPYTCFFYPPNWIFAVASVGMAVRLWWTFHLLLAACSCYALARHWRLGVAASLLAAISFTFSTFFTAWLEFSFGWCCMAWGILALFLVSLVIDRAARSVIRDSESGLPMEMASNFWQNAILIVALAFVLSMQILATVEFFYYMSFLVAAYGITRWWWYRNWKVCGVSLLWLICAGILALGLTMLQWLPTRELMNESIRMGEIEPGFHLSSAHPRHWFTLLLPFLYGRPGYPNLFWAKTHFEFSISTCYIGILPLIAIFFCWIREKTTILNRERRLLVWFFVGALVVGFVLVAGKYTPVYGILHRYLPLLGHFRWPTKLDIYIALSLSMLGAFGFQSLLDFQATKAKSRWFQSWWIAGGAIGGLLIGYCFFDYHAVVWLMAHPGTPTDAQINAAFGDLFWAAAFMALGFVLFSMLLFRMGAARWIQWLIVALAFLNLCIISRQVQPTGPGSIYTKRPLAAAKRMGSDPMYRYISNYQNSRNAEQYLYGEKRLDIWEWAVDSGATCHLQTEGLYNITPGGLSLGRYTLFFETMLTAAPGTRAKLADMLSLRYVMGGAPFEQILWGNASRDIQIAERPTCLPRAFVISRWRFVEGGGDSVFKEILKDSFNPREEAIVEPLAGGIAQAIPSADMVPSSTTGINAGGVRSFVDHGNSVMMEVSAKNRVLLVLGDPWYPGWQANVDGKACSILRTNYLFRGVVLEPGTHQVEFVYKSKSFVVGAWFSILTGAVCCVLVCMAYFRQRRGKKLNQQIILPS